MASKHEFVFRRADIFDIPAVRRMIQELADFENMSSGPKLSDRDLIKDAGLDGSKEYCHIYVLELKNKDSVVLNSIGYSICFFSYSTWEGKSYFLEDIYIKPDYRNLGAGAYLFRSIAAKAKEFNCKRLDFHVLSWNPAKKFYDKMGAKDLTEVENWHFYRLNETGIDKLVSELQ